MINEPVVCHLASQDKHKERVLSSQICLHRLDRFLPSQVVSCYPSRLVSSLPHLAQDVFRVCSARPRPGCPGYPL